MKKELNLATDEFLGEKVCVHDNPETNLFVGEVTEVTENDIDGILISVVDQDGYIFDIESKYVSLYKEA